MSIVSGSGTTWNVPIATQAALDAAIAAVKVPDGTYTDIVVSGTGTSWNIAADAVGTTEIANNAVTAVKIGDPQLQVIAALVPVNDQIQYWTGATSGALTGFTAAARSLLDDTTTAAMLTTLGAIAGGNGATTLWKGTQAQYDAIGTKDGNTVYVVS